MKSSRVMKRQERRKEMKKEKDKHRGERLIDFGFSNRRWVKVVEPINRQKDRKHKRYLRNVGKSVDKLSKVERV